MPQLILAGVTWGGVVAVAHHTMSLGQLVAFLTLYLQLIWPIVSLGWLLALTQEAASAARRIFEVLDVQPTILDPETPVPAESGTSLVFEDVHFRFDDAEHEVLRGVDLHIEPGETMALVGAVGCGKTTLTALVPRLYDVTGGRILIGGVDIRDLRLDQLRHAVTTAFEDATLFSASVRENLTLGRSGVDEDDVVEAIEVAQAGFVYELPFGLDTRIGEQGLSLSGGQRQRLALARAVLGRPRVLVLDDPLSALDVHTEAQVEAALRRVLASTTALVVAHRPSTVLLADRVALLEDGRITAVGTHSELLGDRARPTATCSRRPPSSSEADSMTDPRAASRAPSDPETWQGRLTEDAARVGEAAGRHRHHRPAAAALRRAPRCWASWSARTSARSSACSSSSCCRWRRRWPVRGWSASPSTRRCPTR